MSIVTVSGCCSRSSACRDDGERRVDRGVSESGPVELGVDRIERAFGEVIQRSRSAGRRRTRHPAGSPQSQSPPRQRTSVAVVVLVAEDADGVVLRHVKDRRRSQSSLVVHVVPRGQGAADEYPDADVQRHQRRLALEVIAGDRVRRCASTSTHFSSPVKYSTTGGTRPGIETGAVAGRRNVASRRGLVAN